MAVIKRLSQQTETMYNQSFSTVVVIGRIGIVDAALVRYMEGIKERTGRLLIHVTESIYDSIIPKSHVEGFVADLSIVEDIVEDESEVKRVVDQTKTTLMHLPEEELQQYTLTKILKKASIGNSNNKSENSKLTILNELIQRYGNNPHKREINIGLVSGSFDLIHWGHLLEIKAAKEITDVLIAATMSTDSIRQQGKNIFGDRPIYSQEDRVKVLSSLRTVDYVVIFEELDCKEVIRAIRPNYFIKHEKDMSRRIIKEECELVESFGGKVVITRDEVGYSSTNIINYVRNINNEVG